MLGGGQGLSESPAGKAAPTLCSGAPGSQHYLAWAAVEVWVILAIRLVTFDVLHHLATRTRATLR